MNPQLFEKFLSDSQRELESRTQSQKVRTFIDWCNRNGLEEIVLRLSSEEKGGWSKNYSLTFTTSRIIVNKKKFSTKFVDLGYAAGLAPYPYFVLLEKRDYSKIKEDAAATPEVLAREPNAYHIWYFQIQEFILKHGMRMLGRNITSNFLSITTSAPDNKRFDYTLPISKNGDYDKIHYWLRVALPQNCSIKNS
jgi:hypothetical protein